MSDPRDRDEFPDGDRASSLPVEGEDVRALVDRYGRTFAKGDVFFREDEPAREAYLLYEGRVRVLKRVRAVEQNVAVLKPGDLFGEGALLEGGFRVTTAIGLSEGVVVVLDRATFMHVVRTLPTLAEHVVRQLASRLRQAEGQIEVLMLRDAPAKVVRALLKSMKHGDPSAELSLSPAMLATRAGLDVETVKRVVQKLRSQDYLRIAGERIEIPDIEALRKLDGLLGAKEELRFDR